MTVADPAVAVPAGDDPPGADPAGDDPAGDDPAGDGRAGDDRAGDGRAGRRSPPRPPGRRAAPRTAATLVLREVVAGTAADVPAAVSAAVHRALRDGDGAGVLLLADGYDALLARRVEPGRMPRLVADLSGERRRRGAYATPRLLADALAGRALPPDGSADTTVCDPACGSGALLRAALRRMLGLGVAPGDALAALHGTDVDPVAVAVARAALTVEALEAGAAASPQDLATRVRTGDALLGPAPAAGASQPAPTRGAEPAAEAGPAAQARPDGAPLVWHEAFPHVLDVAGAASEPVTGWRGGFTAVLANPPWERLKVAGREHFAGLPDMGRPGTAAELAGRIRALADSDPAAHTAFTQRRAALAAAALAVRRAGRHPLAGDGEVNAYLPFVETCWRLLHPRGRAALLVPVGLATDRAAAPLLQALVGAGAMESLHVLDNVDRLFPAVSDRVSFALVTLRRGAHGLGGSGAADGPPGVPATAQVAVGLRAPGEDVAGRAWLLDAGVLRRVNPNTGTAALCTGPVDARIVGEVHARVPVLQRRDRDDVLDDPWRLRLRTPLHMTRDSAHFTRAGGPGLVPLWEAKLAGLLDHRAATWTGRRAVPASAAERDDPDWLPTPRYWVPLPLVRSRYGDLLGRGWLAGVRNVTTARSPRTLLPCVLPPVGVGNSLPLVDAPRLPLLLAALSSLPVDYVARQKIGGNNLSFFKIEQLPVPAPAAYDAPAPWEPGVSVGAWVLARLADAVAQGPGIEAFAAELASAGVRLRRRGRGEPVTVGETVRRRARAEVDAAHAHLLGLSRADLEHVVGTFDALAARERARWGRPVTAPAVLDAFDRLTQR